MENPRKLSIKRVEISLTKFNDVAIPHHLDLLRQHKHNIAKFQESGELTRVKNEQINARRLVSQLKNLLSEMEQLRQQVKEQDIDKFDFMTRLSRKKTRQAIMDYLDNPPAQEIPRAAREPSHPPASVQSTLSTDSIGTVMASSIQLIVDKTQLEEEKLRQKEECLKSWEDLQREVQDLYDVFNKFQHVIEEQRSSVDAAEENVDVAALNVDLGRRSLAKAEKFKLAMYPVAGAVIGGCLAGPIGLVAGLKMAGAALIGGSILGFTGGSFLKRKKDAELGGETSLSVLEKDENGESKKDK